MTNKFCIIDSPFEDWSTLIKQNKKIRFFKNPIAGKPKFFDSVSLKFIYQTKSLLWLYN